MEQSNKPVFEIKFGAVRASAWRNQGEKGEFFSIDLSRTYKDQNDQWQTSSRFGLSDLPKVEKAAADAFRRIYQLRAESGEAEPAETTAS